MVRPAANDLERAIELFQDDHARQPVRKRQLRERPDESGLLAQHRLVPFVAADRERDLRRPRDLLRQLLGAQLDAALIQRPQLAAHARQNLVRCFELKQFHLGEALQPLRVFFAELERRALVLPDAHHPNLQGETSMRGASAHNPSRS